ncbi:hypothetical protein [Aeromicrobium sp. UC242_57]|uniref:hypothetical protein n=1 Tax=Aeromicrobium sp. UC242_57 TaxID=3374624 RepID=UPI003792E98B
MLGEDLLGPQVLDCLRTCRFVRGDQLPQHGLVAVPQPFAGESTAIQEDTGLSGRDDGAFDVLGGDGVVRPLDEPQVPQQQTVVPDGHAQSSCHAQLGLLDPAWLRPVRDADVEDALDNLTGDLAIEDGAGTQARPPRRSGGWKP